MAGKPKAPPSQIAAALDVGREVAALRASQAPVVYFDNASTFGIVAGVCNVTVDAVLHHVVDGETVSAVQPVAHLRFPLAALASLKQAIAHIEGQLSAVPLVKN